MEQVPGTSLDRRAGPIHGTVAAGSQTVMRTIRWTGLTFGRSRTSEAKEAAGGNEMTGTDGQNWKLTLAYDGADFHGWQVQPGHTTVQGALAEALERVTGEEVLPQGSGRTDAGVHALGQVASVCLLAPIPEPNLLRALNRTLPPAIRVLRAEHAPESFHARHSVTAKTYEYRLYRGEICPPWLARYMYALNWPLQVDAMRQAAAVVIGEHDFTSFAAVDPDRAERQTAMSTRNIGENADLSRAEPPRSDPTDAGGDARGNVRTIYSSEWVQVDAETLLYRVRGRGFLHHMVRNLVGTFLNVGRGQTSAAAVAEILAARDRNAAGPTAPARGLFLVSVEYDGPDA